MGSSLNWLALVASLLLPMPGFAQARRPELTTISRARAEQVALRVRQCLAFEIPDGAAAYEVEQSGRRLHGTAIVALRCFQPRALMVAMVPAQGEITVLGDHIGNRYSVSSIDSISFRDVNQDQRPDLVVVVNVVAQSETSTTNFQVVDFWLGSPDNRWISDEAARQHIEEHGDARELGDTLRRLREYYRGSAS